MLISGGCLQEVVAYHMDCGGGGCPKLCLAKVGDHKSLPQGFKIWLLEAVTYKDLYHKRSKLCLAKVNK